MEPMRYVAWILACCLTLQPGLALAGSTCTCEAPTRVAADATTSCGSSCCGASAPDDDAPSHEEESDDGCDCPYPCCSAPILTPWSMPTSISGPTTDRVAGLVAVATDLHPERTLPCLERPPQAAGSA